MLVLRRWQTWSRRRPAGCGDRGVEQPPLSTAAGRTSSLTCLVIRPPWTVSDSREVSGSTGPAGQLCCPPEAPHLTDLANEHRGQNGPEIPP
jgi:hypothetical protein